MGRDGECGVICRLLVVWIGRFLRFLSPSSLEINKHCILHSEALSAKATSNKTSISILTSVSWWSETYPTNCKEAVISP